MSRPSRFLQTVTSFFQDQREERIIELMNEPILGPTDEELFEELEGAGFGVVPDEEELGPMPVPKTPLPRSVGIAAARGMTGTVLNEGEMEELEKFRSRSRVPVSSYYCCGGKLYAV